MGDNTEHTPYVVNAAFSGSARIIASCSNLGTGWKYSFSLCKDGAIVYRLDFSDSATGFFWHNESGIYYVKATAIHESGERLTAYSGEVSFEAPTIHIEKNKPKESVFRSTAIVLGEIWENRERMFRLAEYDYRTRNKDSYLGKVWSWLNPLIQILTYWFVFGVGMRGGKPVGDHPYLLWMLTGLLPWFFSSACITGGAGSVYSKAGMVLRIQYPLSTIPVGNTMVNFFEHLTTMVILLAVLLFYGYFPSLVWINLLYYMVCGILFFSSLSMLTSTLTMIARDFQKLITSLIRLLFYLTPILWTLDTMPTGARKILELNPILYLINGYRDSLLFGVNFWERGPDLIRFWFLTILLTLLGCSFHRKYKDYFIDWL